MKPAIVASYTHRLAVAAALMLFAPALLTGCAQTKQKPSRFASPVFNTRSSRITRPTHHDPSPMYVSSYRQAPPPPQPIYRPPAPTPVTGEASWFPPGGIVKKWTDIVVHHSASDSGGATAFDRHHRLVNKWDELGYHFVIGNGTDTANGAVEVGSRWIKQKHGAHCKTPDNYYNDHGIGICLVGNFDNTSPSPQQMASLERLVRFLQQQCGIDTSHVVTHGGVTAKTACPGRNFSIASLRNRVEMGGIYSQAR